MTLIEKLAATSTNLANCEATMRAIERANGAYTNSTQWILASQERGNLIIDCRQLIELIARGER